MPSLARRAGSRRRLLMALAGMLCALASEAAEAPRTFPLWDGKETVESYAARVGMPATKSIDLGGGVTLDLVLIPAGQFSMGSAEPAKPSATETEAIWLIGFGGSVAAFLSLVLLIKCAKQKKFSFSLRWLLLMTIFTGLCIGGIARRSLALKEAARYQREMAEYNALPANEKPAHSVTLTQPFYMGKYAVTQAPYQELIGTVATGFGKSGSQRPADSVSWTDAVAFCDQLTKRLRDGAQAARLPTEAQWEFACRAGTNTRFYSGDQESDLDAVAWFEKNSGKTTHAVGEKKANAFGLHDMHGNVFQWCRDALTEQYEVTDAVDPCNENGVDRVMRGGSYYNNAWSCRSVHGSHNDPNTRNVGVGFRIVVSVPAPGSR